MLDRMLRLIIGLTLLAFFLRVVFGVFREVTDTLLRWAGHLFGLATHALSAALLGVLVLFLAAGLLVRMREGILRRDPRAGRERRAEERLVRHSIRRPAVDVPRGDVGDAASIDADPALNEEDEEDE